MQGHDCKSQVAHVQIYSISASDIGDKAQHWTYLRARYCIYADMPDHRGLVVHKLGQVFREVFRHESAYRGYP